MYLTTRVPWGFTVILVCICYLKHFIYLFDFWLYNTEFQYSVTSKYTAASPNSLRITVGTNISLSSLDNSPWCTNSLKCAIVAESVHRTAIKCPFRDTSVIAQPPCANSHSTNGWAPVVSCCSRQSRKWKNILFNVYSFKSSLGKMLLGRGVASVLFGPVVDLVFCCFGV